MPLNEGQRRAQAWFDGLEPLTREQAIAMIVDRPELVCAHGTITDRMSRDNALKLIENGARHAPEDQFAMLNDFMVVAIDDDGFPVQLQTNLGV